MDNKQLGCWYLARAMDTRRNVSYFVGANVRGLFCWNHHTNEIERIDSLEHCAADNMLYDVGIIRGDEVFFPPKNTTELLIYNRSDQSVRYRSLYSEDVMRRIGFRTYYYGHIAYKDNEDTLYFFYREYPIVTIYNKNGVMEQEFFEMDSPLNLGSIYDVHDAVLYMPAANRNLILSYDTKKRSFEGIEIHNLSTVGFSSCIHNGSSLILTSHDGKSIIRYDFETKETLEVRVPTADIDQDDLYQIKQYQSGYILVPLLDVKKEKRMDCIYILDADFHLIETKAIDEPYAKMKKWSVSSEGTEEYYFMFEAVFGDDGDMFFAEKMQLVKLDYEKLIMTNIEYPMPERFDGNTMSKLIVNNQIAIAIKYYDKVFENPRISVEEYIDYISNLE